MYDDDEMPCGDRCLGVLTPTEQPTDIPEPPDGSRIEFEHHTDIYGAWSDSAPSVEAGWSPTQRWCVYPGAVPHDWACMQRQFGESLRTARRMVFTD